jgi:DNA methylase
VTTPYYSSEHVALHLGDCLDVLPDLPDASVDAICTDPPYELAFMGRSWDSSGIAFNPAMWAEVLRVLKPGGHLVAFGGTRTYHRVVCAIEDAGFEIRDSIHWIFGTGFPKSLDVGKAIDKAAGAERKVVGMVPPSAGGGRSTARDGWWRPWMDDESARDKTREITVPATADAARWDGWGTALKPAHEPIVLARKPLAGTVAGNVLEHGTGALNIDRCRVAAGQDYRDKCASVVGLDSNRNGDAYGAWTGTRVDSAHESGRWPTNVVFSHPPLLVDGEVIGDACADGCVDGCPVAELDRQSGVTKSSGGVRGGRIGANGVFGEFEHNGPRVNAGGLGDEGGASRFFPIFRYEAKASASERPRLADGTAHTTVKPLALMRWLVRLVTPPGGTILDPFAGSGTTGEACVIEGFRAVLIEREEPHAELIKARLAKDIQPVLGFGEIA